jgi:biopolymer transport protein ExbD
MAFGSFSTQSHRAPQAEINMIPLIDVMLVLLVIFIITAPLLTHAVKVDLPKASSAVNHTKPDNIQFAIDEAGRLYWNGEIIERGVMVERFAAAGKLNPTPEVHLRVDGKTAYQVVADVMSEASKANLSKIGFVTDPTQGR